MSNNTLVVVIGALTNREIKVEIVKLNSIAKRSDEEALRLTALELEQKRRAPNWE